MAKSNEELLALMAEGIESAVEELVKRAKSGEISAAEISRLREFFKDAGGTLLSSQGRPSKTGDSVLDSMADLPDETLERLH